jgi:hypothetical protein
MLVAPEEHDGTWVVDFVHGVEVRDLLRGALASGSTDRRTKKQIRGSEVRWRRVLHDYPPRK